MDMRILFQLHTFCKEISAKRKVRKDWDDKGVGKLQRLGTSKVPRVGTV